MLTIVVLILLDPNYTTAYISVNYEIVLIYIISALTLLYCVVSIVMYAIMSRRSGVDDRPASMTNCALSVCAHVFSVIPNAISNTNTFAHYWIASSFSTNTSSLLFYTPKQHCASHLSTFSMRVFGFTMK